ncbi:MAG: SOS response-associated peptidase [Acidimicrobiales bacterium]
MCGRYVSASTPEDLARFLDVEEVRTDDLADRYNVAPTDPVYAAAERKGVRVLGQFRWGLVPHWAKDRRVGAKMINARAETLTSKFGKAFERRRCLVPADGFYEWEKLDDGTKQPWFIHRADRTPMAFAGLWEVWNDPSEPPDAPPLQSCTIITCAANELIEPLHNRMPVVVAPSDWEQWLDRSNHDTDSLRALLGPADARAFERWPVSTRVNSVRNDGPDLLERVPTE